MRDDEEAPLEDEIAIEQLAEELWQKTTKGAVADWRALSVLQKQAPAKRDYAHAARTEQHGGDAGAARTK